MCVFLLNPHLELRSGRTDERAFTHRSDKGQPRKMPLFFTLYIYQGSKKVQNKKWLLLLMPIARDQHYIAINNDHHDEVRDVTLSFRQGRRRRLKKLCFSYLIR